MRNDLTGPRCAGSTLRSNRQTHTETHRQKKECQPLAPRGLIKTKNMSRMLSSKDIGHPDEIRAKKISSRLNRRRISEKAHLTPMEWDKKIPLGRQTHAEMQGRILWGEC